MPGVSVEYSNPLPMRGSRERKLRVPVSGYPPDLRGCRSSKLDTFHSLRKASDHPGHLRLKVTDVAGHRPQTSPSCWSRDAPSTACAEDRVRMEARAA